MYQISVSFSAADISDKEFSGKDHGGSRLPVHEDADRLTQLTPDEWIHKEKKKGKDPARNTAVPHQDSEHGETLQVHVEKEIWLGRRERDPAPKKRRLMRKTDKTFDGGLK